MICSIALTIVIGTIVLMIIRCRVTYWPFKLFLMIWKKTVKLPYTGLSQWHENKLEKVSIYAFVSKLAWCNHLKLCDDISINWANNVKVLGVIIDNRLAFAEHIRISCKKATRQLNVLPRFAIYSDMNSKILIFSRFNLSNFNDCLLVWHLCSKGNSNTNCWVAQVMIMNIWQTSNLGWKPPLMVYDLSRI